MIAITILIIYLLSVIGNWLIIRHEHLTEYKTINPDGRDFIITVCPIVNTGMVLVELITLISKNLKIDYNNFFKIPKR